MATGAEEPRCRPLHRVYVIATSHLDDQWRWTIQDTIDDFLPDTLHGNFALFEKYPGYTFSFEGAFRYMLIKEYYPEEYEQLKAHIRDGRWKVSGSWIAAATRTSTRIAPRQTLPAGSSPRLGIPRVFS
jgi:alpha-mannosidase